MKKLISLFSAVLIGASAFAQLDRSVRPEPAPAAELEFGEYDLYELDNGLKVIVVENDKLPRITYSLIVDRMPIKEGDKAGYVGLAGELLRQGTTNRSKDQLDEEIDFIGANLSTSSSSIYVSGLSKYNEKLLELMADVALNPAFPEAEFEKLKKQSLSGIESAKDDPDALSARLFNATVYGTDHPYGELTTESTYENVSLEDCKNYYQNYWAPNKTYIAVVGDIKARKAKKLIKKYFGDWERKEVPEPSYEEPASPKGKVVNIINRSNSSQTVLRLGNTMQLKPGASDVVKLDLTDQILGGGSLGRLFQNIREDKGYTYGAYSSYDDDRLIGEFSASASVRTEVTDSAIDEFLYEFDRIRTEPVSDADIQAAKNYIAGSYGRSLESPQTMASFALNIQRYDLPEDYYENYLKRLEALTSADIMEAAKKYIKTDAMTITAVGKGSVIGEKLEKYGPVTYYNYKGEKVDPPSMPLPEGLTAEKVIEDYIEALGGSENLAKIDDITMQMSVSMSQLPPGMSMNATVKRKRPHYFLNVIEMTGQGTLQKMLFTGDEAFTSSMMGGDTAYTEGSEFEAMKDQAQFFPEERFKELGYEMKLTGMEMVEGEKAYAVEVTNPAGETSTHYYSEESHLKIREVSTQETPQGEVSQQTDYMDYQDVEGVKFPYVMKQTAGPQKITLNVTELKVNSGLKESEFSK